MRIRLSQLKSIIKEEVTHVTRTLSEAEFKKSPHWSGEHGHIQLPRNVRHVAESIKEYVDMLMTDAVADPTTESLVRTNLQAVFEELLKSGPKPLSVVRLAKLSKEARNLTMHALEYIDENLEELSESLETKTAREGVVEDLIFNVFTTHQTSLSP